jgi:hypothetical protein
MLAMGEHGVDVSLLRLKLTTAEQKRETARVAVISLEMGHSNRFALEEARRNLESATLEVEQVRRQIEALEKAE